jgi:sugar lactone lactonase YvrE
MVRGLGLRRLRFFTVLGLFALATMPAGAAQGDIHTHSGGFTGDGGPATLASLKYPGGLALDGAGNLFIADVSNRLVRRVDASTGAIGTVAGSGASGHAGDGELARSPNVALLSPADVAVAPNGDVYIAEGDYSGGWIRKVSDGRITTVAGGGPRPDVYGIVPLEAAPGTASFFSPSAIALDAAGTSLYISDTYYQKVRRLDLTTGLMRTIVHLGPYNPGSYGGDGGPALAAGISGPRDLAIAGDTLYFADRNNNRVRAVNLSTGTIETAAGDGTCGQPSSICLPRGVALDDAGNLYVTEEGDYYGDGSRVRKVDPSGIVTTVAGNGSGGFSGDGGPATGAAMKTPAGIIAAGGSLIVADSGNNRIRTIAGGIITTVAGAGSSLGDGGSRASATFGRVHGLARDASGNLYVADDREHRVRKVDPAGTITTFAGNGSCPRGGPGVPNYGENGPATAALVCHPLRAAFDALGSAYITVGRIVWKVDVAGVITRFASNNGCCAFDLGDGDPLAARFYSNGIAVTPDGSTVYLASGQSGRILRITGGVLSVIGGNGQSFTSTGDGGPAANATFNYPVDLALRANDLYVAELFGQRVRKIDLTTSIVTTVAGGGACNTVCTGLEPGEGIPATQARLADINGIDVTASGDLYLTQGYVRGGLVSGTTIGSRILKVDGITGILNVVAGTNRNGYYGDEGPATAARLYNPYDVLVIGSALYISDYENARIRVVEL